MLNIHPDAKISPLADIEQSVRGTKIVIGAYSIIDSFVKIKPAGGLGNLTVGMRTIINSGCVMYTGNGISIGDDVAIAANCTFAPVNHAYSDRNQKISAQGFQLSRGGIIVEDDVWIGSNCVLLDGAHIGLGCVIGAGSIIKGRLDPYTVYVGNPLRKIGSRK